MSKVTKWAVEAADREMREAQGVMQRKWQHDHPCKAKDLTSAELVVIAMKDPKWQEYVVRRAKNYSRIDIDVSTLSANSPKVKAVVEANNKVDTVRDKEYEKVCAENNRKRAELIRRAIIGGMDSTAFLKEVNEFCNMCQA